MTDTTPKTIGIVLIDGYADWEFGILSGGAADHLPSRIVFLSPENRPVVSIGGLEARPSRGISPDENTDLDAVALIGSDTWAGANPPDLAPLLRSVRERGGVIGGICAATIPLARGGFVDGRKHTSNGPDWLKNIAGAYAGIDLYQNVPHAVADGQVVTASGTAPVSFAAEFLAAVYPGQRKMMDGVKEMFAAEHM